MVNKKKAEKVDLSKVAKVNLSKPETIVSKKSKSETKREEVQKSEPISTTVSDGLKLVYPTIDHLKVIEILEDGRESETHFHCKMSDGTTRHVEKRLFQ